jgi:nicotinamide mononucleotide adenylyltransferase
MQQNRYLGQEDKLSVIVGGEHTKHRKLTPDQKAQRNTMYPVLNNQLAKTCHNVIFL